MKPHQTREHHRIFRGIQEFTWPAQIELAFCKQLGGERKRVGARGSFVFEFGDDGQDITPFQVRSFSIRVDDFDVYYGQSDYRPRLQIPSFTLTSSRFTQNQAWLQRSTGQFVMSLQIKLDPAEVPLIGTVQQLGILPGTDFSTLTAQLAESGHINGETGAFRADGTLRVGDKDAFNGPGEFLVHAGSLQCDASGDLTGTLDPSTQASGDILVPCVGDPVTLVYHVQNATAAWITGSDMTRIDLDITKNTTTVTPTKQGAVNYQIHVRGKDCEVSAGDVRVIAVGDKTPFQMLAIGKPLTPSEPADAQQWIFNLGRGVVSPKITVKLMQIDLSAPRPNDALGNPINAFNCTFADLAGFIRSSVIGTMAVPIPDWPLAGTWVFTTVRQVVDPAHVYPVAPFLLSLTCPMR